MQVAFAGPVRCDDGLNELKSAGVHSESDPHDIFTAFSATVFTANRPQAVCGSTRRRELYRFAASRPGAATCAGTIRVQNHGPRDLRRISQPDSRSRPNAG